MIPNIFAEFLLKVFKEGRVDHFWLGVTPGIYDVKEGFDLHEVEIEVIQYTCYGVTITHARCIDNLHILLVAKQLTLFNF